MPLDTNLILRAGQSNAVGVPELLKQAAGTYDALHALPIARQQRELGLEQQQQRVKSQGDAMQRQQELEGQEQQVRKANVLLNTAKALRELPQAQRRTYISTLDQDVLSEFGVDESKIASMQLDDASLDNAISQTSAIINQSTGQSSATASEREREMLYSELDGAVDESGNLKPLNELTARQTAAARALNIIARPVGSASQTITQEGTAEDVAKTEQVLSEAKQTGKNLSDLELKPQIQEAVKAAELAAKDRGESLTEYDRAKAAYPGLKEVVGNLQELAPLATYSVGGRVFDTASAQLGFGATDGADARAKFIATIDNQVLPLLKATFGAAFTEKEGEALRKTMGDPNATPSEKLQQMDAFMESIDRELERKRTLAEGGQDEPQRPSNSGGIKFLGFE